VKIMTKTTICLYAAVTVLIAGCTVSVTPGTVEFAPPVVAVYPESYVWDGYEYVGVRGGQYFYLNPGGVWLVADPVILDRFNGWARFHPDWRRSATRYVPGQRIERRDRVVEHRDQAVEHREEQKKAPAPQNKKAPPPQNKKTKPPEEKKEP
jgi:hypothetical protein